MDTKTQLQNGSMPSPPVSAGYDEQERDFDDSDEWVTCPYCNDNFKLDRLFSHGC